jgi:sulfur carrier protein ThiS
MNYDKYIGLPYLDNGRTTAGLDCWGLARLFYKNEYNIELPSYVDEYVGGTDPYISQAVNLYKDNWEEITTPNVGDLCLFNIFGEPMHVGIYVGDNKFLHCRIGSDSVIESLNNIKWKNRFVGFYVYAPQAQVQAVGAPHPLKLRAHRDWTAAGTTIQDFVEFVKTKYTSGTELIGKIVVMLDGVVVPKADWETTRVKAGQELSYKTVAQGNNTTRMLIMIAAFVITGYTPTGSELTIGQQVGAMVPGVSAANAGLVGSLVISSSAMILSNVIAPIRPPKSNDPGSANALNLLTGAANQANLYGAIPVVLGKVRFTGVLGANPYVESLTETNVLNTAIVWGFGPLAVNDICIGTKPILDFYTGEPTSVPRPVTLEGYAKNYAAGALVDDFNALYGRDVESQAVNLELTNNATNISGGFTNTSRWQQVNLNQTCDAVDVVLSFPEGMRKINTKNGTVGATSCKIEIQMRPYSTAPWTENDTSAALSIYDYKSGDPTAFTLYELTPPTDASDSGLSLYRYTTFCLSPNGGTAKFDGAPTDVLGANASANLQALYANTGYSSLTNSYVTKGYLPEIPPGYLPLYTFYQNSQGTYTLLTNHITGYSGVTGLTYSDVSTPELSGSGDSITWSTPAVKTIKIMAGRVYSQSSGADPSASEQLIWTSLDALSAGGVVRKSSGGKWGSFLSTYGVWGSTYTTPAASGYGGSWVKVIPNINFPYTGYYTVEAAADDQGEILIDGVRAVQIPKSGDNNSINSIKGVIKLKAGLHSITLSGVDNQANDMGIAAKITYFASNGLNLAASQNTILTFGEGAWFEKRKDAFNWVHSVENLARARYQVRVRRTTSDETEDEADFKKFHKAILSGVIGYDKQEQPMINPPGCYLAKTAVRIQSNNKINGQIDGINALVQTVTWDYERATSSWENLRATNNPASLFVYVLTHPANAFRVKLSQLDVANLTTWHNFCNPVPQTVATPSMVKGRSYTISNIGSTTQADWNILAGTSGIVYDVGDSFEVQVTGGVTGTGTGVYAPKFAYNGVLTSTQSVMDTLRDICAAGKASPSYIDGKWGVIIDTPRSHTVQHFTEHNSWGFESTKVLPILPHAFRVSINDESNAYQVREFIVYNYGYGPTTSGSVKGAELFEQLSLPGVTNIDQAIRLARWHFAQLKLRPETYTVNVDFEHLVCTRGDKVKISHSVPQWGVGSGRLGTGVGDSITGTSLTLREPVLLTSGTTYTILIRTNYLTSTTGSGSVSRTFTYSGTTGYTSTITVPTIALADGVESDNLFMIGLSTVSTQECIVVGVEPSGNYSARLTLVDYSPDIYTMDLSSLIVYNPNLTTNNIPLIKNTITKAPIINSVISSSTVSSEIATGSYQNKAIVSFTNPSDLPAVATRVQFDIIEGSIPTFSTNPGETRIVNKETSSYTFEGLTSGLKYKIRARYLGNTNEIAGPWSIDYAFTNDGKNRNFSVPPALVVDLENTYIVLDPTIVDQPSDFKAYAYRLYRDTGTTDLWNTTPVIPEMQSQGQGRLDLLLVPLITSGVTTPRISEAGINYRIACRVLDKTGNYSETSSYASILVRNIV